MSRYTITIDTGTTNTRALLLDENRRCLQVERAEVGVRDTAITGSKASLTNAVRDCVHALLHRQGIGFEDVAKVLAGGMITSNVGLVEVPHLTAPVGLRDLAEGVRAVRLEEICPLPIYFVPGVKNSADTVTLENFEAMDIMRGEEVESFALLEDFPPGREYLLVLPGSHTKFVSVDRQGRITGCMTTLTGELLAAVTRNTILTDAVGGKFTDESTYDRTLVLAGYDAARQAGISRAAFSTRILSLFAGQSAEKAANYLLGALLQGDVAAVLHSSALRGIGAGTEAIVGGKAPFQRALADIFLHEGCFGQVHEACSNRQLPLSAAGVCMVAELIK